MLFRNVHTCMNLCVKEGRNSLVVLIGVCGSYWCMTHADICEEKGIHMNWCVHTRNETRSPEQLFWTRRTTSEANVSRMSKNIAGLGLHST